MLEFVVLSKFDEATPHRTQVSRAQTPAAIASGCSLNSLCQREIDRAGEDIVKIDTSR